MNIDPVKVHSRISTTPYCTILNLLWRVTEIAKVIVIETNRISCCVKEPRCVKGYIECLKVRLVIEKQIRRLTSTTMASVLLESSMQESNCSSNLYNSLWKKIDEVHVCAHMP